MLLFAGDPHGAFEPINRAADEMRPDGVVLLGDFDLDVPLDQALNAPARQVAWWIHGNHDCDRDFWHDRLFQSELADRSLHGRVVELGGYRVAGLGGVFREKVWHPDTGVRFASRRQFLYSMGRGNKWRGGLPLKQRASLWWEDYERLWGKRADILVTHEAPSCHRHGFKVLDELAEAMGARMIVHGHHHEDYQSELASGIRVIGVGLAGVTSDAGQVIVPGRVSTRRRPA